MLHLLYKQLLVRRTRRTSHHHRFNCQNGTAVVYVPVPACQNLYNPYAQQCFERWRDIAQVQHCWRKVAFIWCKMQANSIQVQLINYKIQVVLHWKLFANSGDVTGCAAGINVHNRNSGSSVYVRMKQAGRQAMAKLNLCSNKYTINIR